VVNVVHGLLTRTTVVEVAYNGTLNAVYDHEKNDCCINRVFFLIGVGDRGT